MTGSTSSNRRMRSSLCRTVLFGSAVSMALVAVPAAAQATPRPQAASSYCAHVSAASVSAIVGYRVPAGSPTTNRVKATKANYGISAVVSSCLYGTITSMASLSKDVILSREVTSRPLTGAEVQKSLRQASKLFKFTPYSGLGMTAFYYAFTESGITTQGLAGISGTKIYFAGLYTKAPAQSKLAALVRLAERI